MKGTICFCLWFTNKGEIEPHEIIYLSAIEGARAYQEAKSLGITCQGITVSLTDEFSRLAQSQNNKDNREHLQAMIEFRRGKR